MIATRRYATAQNETASPERLMVLLFEAALRHVRTGYASLEAGQQADGLAALARAAEIVGYLDATFDPARAPELARLLGPLYQFVGHRLLRAQYARDPASAREAERALAPIADGFSTAVQKLAAEKVG